MPSPARNTTGPTDQRRRDTRAAPPKDELANLAATPLVASISPGRIRLCILCGQPLRAGQHMLRIHGSTIHACCNKTGR